MIKLLLGFSLFFFITTVTAQFSNSKADNLKALTESKDLQVRASSYIDLALLYQNEDSIAANLFYNSFKSIDLSEINDSLFLSLAKKQINFLKNKFDFKESISVLNKALIISNSIKSKRTQAKLHQLIAPNYFFLFNYDSCEYHLDKAIGIYTALNDYSELGQLAIRKSGTQYALGNYEKAIEHAFNATELFKKSNDKDQLSVAYLQLGNIFFFLTDFEEASEYFKLSIKAFKNSKNDKGYYRALSNLGLVKTLLNKHRESINIQLQAVKYFEDNFQELEKGNSYRYLSVAYEGLNILDSAEYYNELAIKSNRITNYTVGLAQGFIMRSKLASRDEDFLEALSWASQGLEIADSVSHFETQRMASSELSTIYEKLNKPKESLLYLRKANLLRDSLDIDENQLKKYAEKHRSQVEDYEYELLIANNKAKIEKDKSAQREKLLVGSITVSIISLLLLLAAILFLVKNRKLTKELAGNQVKIKEELIIKESLLSEIHHRVKNNLQVISSMLSLQSQYIDDNKFQKIISDCKSRINSMSLIHESLYKKVDGKEAHFSKYIRNLIPRLIHTYQIDESKINLKMDLEDIYLSLDESIPCGLIINEIVSNSLKHAFPDGKIGLISIQLKKIGNKIHLNISDNGVGFSEGENLNNLESFGFLLIDTLANQLEAKLVTDKTKGVNYTITWESSL